jgi:hypothetical protein
MKGLEVYVSTDYSTGPGPRVVLNIDCDAFDLSYDDAVKFIATRFKACTEEVAKEVLRKPMSYLTKAHDQEITDLQNIISELENDQSDIFEMLTKKYKALKTKILKATAPNTTKFI